jgi:hypothetical protein
LRFKGAVCPISDTLYDHPKGLAFDRIRSIRTGDVSCRRLTWVRWVLLFGVAPYP